MSSPNLPPLVLPALDTVDVQTRHQERQANTAARREQQRAIKNHNQAIERGERAAEELEVANHQDRLYRMLGAKAMAQKIDENDFAGPEGVPKPRTKEERDMDTQILDAAVTERYATAHETTTIAKDRRGIGSKRTWASHRRRVAIKKDKSLSATERAKALDDAKIPLRRVPKYERQATKNGSSARAKVKEIANRPERSERFEKAKDDIIESHEQAERTLKHKQLLEVDNKFQAIDQEVNAEARSYNKGVKQTNRLRKNYIKRVERSARLDIAIDNKEARTGRQAKVRRTLRNANERLTQRAERRGAEVRTKTNTQAVRHEKARDFASRKKEAIADYLDMAAVREADARGLANENQRHSVEAVANAPEVFPRLSLEEAVEALSYGDVLSQGVRPEEVAERAAALKQVLDSPSGRKYTASLQELSEKYGAARLSQTAEQLVIACMQELATLGLDVSKYGRSLSWALWDMAKQNYYVNNPAEADPNYSQADPMVDSAKLNEIIDRHIGWELFRAFNTTMSDAEKAQLLANPKVTPEVVSYLRKAAKPESHTLSSRDLAKLGSLLRLTSVVPQRSRSQPIASLV